VNTADPRDVKAEQDAAAQLAAQRAQDLLWVLSDDRGRRVLLRVLALCHVYTSSFHPSGSSVYLLEGERNIGLKLVDELQKADPEAYARLLLEKLRLEGGGDGRAAARAGRRVHRVPDDVRVPGAGAPEAEGRDAEPA
jgi:hypothetical protein